MDRLRYVEYKKFKQPKPAFFILKLFFFYKILDYKGYNILLVLLLSVSDSILSFTNWKLLCCNIYLNNQTDV